MNFIIKNESIQASNESDKVNFPKYTSQLINWANQNAQGTRPKVVGQLSELFREYHHSAGHISIDDSRNWYLNRYPNAIETATAKIFEQIKNLKEAIKLIDEKMVEKWVGDLVITKTYNGMYVQKAILSALAKNTNHVYRLASPKEESIGIDGYVGGTAYSIKPDSYKTMGRLSEEIDVSNLVTIRQHKILLVGCSEHFSNSDEL